ncbi:MAG: hypothetical protein DMF53_08635 [Acidobacteria bacterium]|nr:MAG: hypothetical protein DMF53_08635 [Acidobacteriota bacterium]
MADTKTQQNPATIRPCTASGIVYEAYQRLYDGGPSKVLNLFASCFYGDGPWEIFFVGVEGGAYQLMERVPTITFGLVSYYATSYCSGAGLLELGDTVTIIDAYGEHQVPVEAIG